jgi:hypothetical protein
MKEWPKEVQAAIDVLWKYADDAYLGGRTKSECWEEGYECSDDEGAFMVTFCIPRNGRKSDLPVTPPCKSEPQTAKPLVFALAQ